MAGGGTPASYGGADGPPPLVGTPGVAPALAVSPEAPAPRRGSGWWSGSRGRSSYNRYMFNDRSPTCSFHDEYGMSVPLEQDDIAELLDVRSIDNLEYQSMVSGAGPARGGGGGEEAGKADLELESTLPCPAPVIPAAGAAGDKSALLPAAPAPDAKPEPSLARTNAASAYAPIWQHKRVRELWTTPDWWSVWIGCANFIGVVICAVLKDCGATKEDGEHCADDGLVVPFPTEWRGNPLDAWDTWTGVGTVCLFPFMAAPLFGALYVMGKFTRSFARGFLVVFLLAVLCFWVGHQKSLSSLGLGPAMVGLLLGLFLVNVVGMFVSVAPLAPVAAQGEWFIKIALVLMAVELKLLGEYGAPGVIVGWVCSPISIAFTYWFGTRVLKMENKVLCMLMGCGVSWCGASAITAVAPSLKAEPGDVTVCIGVVCFFVIFQTFACAYFARGVGMDDMVAGAWLGGSVDQTANVVIAGDIVSADAKQVAGTVKMILNAGLGAMCVGVAMFWVTKVEAGVRPTAAMLWDKFPKFVVGFLALSCVLSIIVGEVNEARHHALPKSSLAMSNWWMAVGFICIGLNTDIRKLSQKVQGGSVLLLYLVGGLWDLTFTYGAAHLFFSGVISAFPRPDGINTE